MEGYKFILPETYDNSESSSELIFHRNFSNGQNINKSDFLSIQISENIPICQLEFFGSRKTLSFYAEEIVHEWLRGLTQTIDIIKHSSFEKRMNLNADKAKWEGYNIILKDGDNFLYFVGVLRRLFIPPDLTTFSDFLVMMKFDIHG